MIVPQLVELYYSIHNFVRNVLMNMNVYAIA